jgi:hypothetical protein
MRSCTAPEIPLPARAQAQAARHVSRCSFGHEPGHKITRCPAAGVEPGARSVRCSTCGQQGHNARSRNCPGAEAALLIQGAAAREDFAGVLAHQEGVVGGRHRLRPMQARCQCCNALMWHEETTGHHRGTFRICCRHGRVQLPPVPPLPPILHELTTHQHQDSSIFLKNIRALNAKLAFHFYWRLRGGRHVFAGAPCYVISGEMHHLIGSLLPSEGEGQGRFAQLYLYDAHEATVTRTAYLLRVVRDRVGRAGMHSLHGQCLLTGRTPPLWTDSHLSGAGPFPGSEVPVIRM